MRILLSGGSGFVGSRLVARLLRAGHRPVLVQRASSAPVPVGCGVVPWDGDPLALRQRCEGLGCEAVIHLATLYRRDHVTADLAGMAEANLLLGMALAEAVRGSPCRRFVNASTVWQSSGRGGGPVNLYAATKLAFSHILRHCAESWGFGAVTLLIADSYGDDDRRPRFLTALRDAWRAGRPLAASGGEQVIDLLHVDDLCAAFEHALGIEMDGRYAEFTLPSGEPLNLRQLVARIERAIGEPVPVTWGARPYSSSEVFRPDLSVPPLPGWRPAVPLEVGLARMFSRIDSRP